MPSINVVRDHLYEALGQQFTEDQFNDLCFEFGIELDKVYEELREVRRFCQLAIAAGSERCSQLLTCVNGVHALLRCGCDCVSAQVDGKKQNVTLFKIDIGANRYDLLSIEGLARALRIFMEKEQAPVSALATLCAAFCSVSLRGAAFSFCTHDGELVDDASRISHIFVLPIVFLFPRPTRCTLPRHNTRWS